MLCYNLHVNNRHGLHVGASGGDKAFCCGRSLANIKIKNEERAKIRDKALKVYSIYGPDYLVTSCPLCKKTFAANPSIQVGDISELLLQAVVKKEAELEALNSSKQLQKELEEISYV